MPRSHAGQQVKCGNTDKKLETTLDKLRGDTVRLRTQSENTWSRKMTALVRKVAESSLVPLTTLKAHFKRRMEKERSTLSQAEQALQRAKKKSDAKGKLKGYEMDTLYQRMEYMGTQYTTPTPLELRAQSSDTFS